MSGFHMRGIFSFVHSLRNREDIFMKKDLGSLKRSYLELMDFFDLMRYNHLDSYAAASAFFLFISLIPLLMLILSIVPYTPLTDEYLIKLITDLSPDRFDEFVTAIIMSVYDNSPAVLSISAIVCVWSASRSILAIQRGLNDILELKETRNYFLMRIRAAFYMLIMLASIVVILIISVFGERISSHVSERNPQAAWDASGHTRS